MFIAPEYWVGWFSGRLVFRINLSDGGPFELSDHIIVSLVHICAYLHVFKHGLLCFVLLVHHIVDLVLLQSRQLFLSDLDMVNIVVWLCFVQDIFIATRLRRVLRCSLVWGQVLLWLWKKCYEPRIHVTLGCILEHGLIVSGLKLRELLSVGARLGGRH